MSEHIIRRVKNSLNLQSYVMNDSWLTDCIEYYLHENENPTQDEIITFVISQWQLCDLREINNENGSLPKNLAKQKCVTLPGKYILQMDKIYDISTSKYKQLEKIRNVSSENIEATENEAKTQEDRFQSWEPKSKRMLQLFLTDGIQNVLAIEYKPIKSLKDNLFPGYKVMIKGPVTCRKGVILLQEGNISEIGGEVDCLLIPNAAENVFARALNLEENPDPYNDNNKNIQDNQSAKSRVEIEDDFIMDSDVIDQIEKQIERYSSPNTSLNSSVKRGDTTQTSESRNNINNYQKTTNKAQNSRTFHSENQHFNSDRNSNTSTNRIKKSKDNSNVRNQTTNFEDIESYSDIFDNKMLDKLPLSKRTSSIPSTSGVKKQSSSLQSIQNQHENDFPMENEIYDLTENSSPYFKTSRLENESDDVEIVFDKISTQDSVRNKNVSYTSEKSKQNDRCSKNTSKNNSSDEEYNKNKSWKLPSPLKSANVKQFAKNRIDFPDDDFEISDVDIKSNNLNDYINKTNKTKTNSHKSSQGSSHSTLKLNANEKMEYVKLLFNSRENSSDSYDENNFEEQDLIRKIGTEFQNDFNEEFESNINIDNKLSTNKKKTNSPEKQKTSPRKEKIKTSTITSQSKSDSTSVTESTRTKRLASMSPDTDVPQKVRCVQNSPKNNATNDRKMSDFQNKSSSANSYIPTICELMCELLKQPARDEVTQTLVRGKVIKIIKLSLFKGENGNYFHLEGTITDFTATLDIVFSSKVLENLIGYTAQEFSIKRRQSKTNPAIKDQLREDLKKAQQTLRVMDALMEIEYKKNEKSLILDIREMTEEQKEFMNFRAEQEAK